MAKFVERTGDALKKELGGNVGRDLGRRISGGGLGDMKLIFLDIDGVLNSVAWQENRPPKEPPGLILDALAHWKRSLDPQCIERLNRIWQETGAAVVISSFVAHDAGVAGTCRNARCRWDAG